VAKKEPNKPSRAGRPFDTATPRSKTLRPTIFRLGMEAKHHKTIIGNFTASPGE
jgi:hypothetical protein